MRFGIAPTFAEQQGTGTSGIAGDKLISTVARLQPGFNPGYGAAT